MKHLYLASGLLIGTALAGCGDYGDDGAVYSTGSDTAELSSTDFNLAVAFPSFDGLSGKLQRSGQVTSRALTGNAPVEDLLQANVRAYVIVPDDSSIAGYREVPIEVVEFENLGSGRYRIAIDGQAQVDGFFAITIGGIEFRIPMSRTGTTDEPIDVNVLQAALADRLQSLLVANEVCDAVTTERLNAVFDAGETYMTTLDVPSSINDAAALIEFYRVAVGGFIQAEITQLCAPALDLLAIDGVVGTYHSLKSGVFAQQDTTSSQPGTLIDGFAIQSSVAIALGTVTGVAVLTDSIESESRYRITHAEGSNGLEGVITDLSVQFPDVSAQQSTVTMQAFANDAGRVALQHGFEVKVLADTGGQTFVPGFFVKSTPAWQQYPLADSLVGASSTTLAYAAITTGDATCLASLGLTTAALADAQAFVIAVQDAVTALGDTEFAARLQADCGGLTAQGLDVSLRLDTKTIAAGTPLDLANLAGRYAFVGLESAQQVSAVAATSGYRGAVADRVFDIDIEGVMTPVSRNRSTTFQPVAAALGGVDAIAMLSSDETFIELPLDQTQTQLTDGHIQVGSIEPDGTQKQMSGFVSPAPHNLMALNLSSYSNNGGKVGGYTVVDSLPAVQGSSVQQSGDLAIAYDSGSINAVDVSNPANLQLLSTFTGLSGVQALRISQNAQYAFAAAGSQGLQIIDIRDPFSLAVVGTGLGTPSILSATQLALVHDAQGVPVLALVGDSTSTGLLHAVDVSDPAAPALLGSYDLGAGAYVSSLAVSGNAALVGTGGSALLILDFAQFLDADGQTNSFTLIPNSLVISNWVQDIEVAGNTAWLCDDRTLLSIDISNLNSVSQIGSVDVVDSASAVSIYGDRAYVALNPDGYSETAVVDISNSANPVLIAHLPAAGENVVANGYLLVGTTNTNIGLAAIEVRNTDGPQQVGSLGGFASDLYFAVSGNVAFVINGTDGLSAVDISDVAKPVLLDTLGTTALAASPQAIAVAGNYAYVTLNNLSLVVVDVSDPANLSVVGTPFTLAGVGANITVFTQGTGTYLAIGASPNLLLVDVTTPTTPSLAQTVVIGDTLADTAVSSDGNTVYVAGANAVYVVNTTVIANAVVSGSVTGVTSVQDVELSGNTLFATTFFSGVQVIDVTTPASAVVVGSFYDLQNLAAMQLVGSTAYLLGSYGVTVADVTDPLAFRPLGFIAHSSNATDISVVGSTVLVGAYDISQQLPYQLALYEVAETQTAVSGLAVGVRLPTPVLADAQELVGLQFALAGQQLAQLNASTTSRQAAFAALGAGSLRFVAVGADVYPVFDLPLAGMAVVDFSGVLPKLELRFAQWVPEPVEVDGNGRWSFKLAATGGDVTNFAGYLGADGLLVGRASLFVADVDQPGNPAAVEGGFGMVYPGLVEASQALIVGVPRT